MLTKQTVLSRTEVDHRTGTIFAEYTTLLVEDGDVANAAPLNIARTSFEPNEITVRDNDGNIVSGDRILAQDPYVQDLATRIWTPEVVDAYKARHPKVP